MNTVAQIYNERLGTVQSLLQGYRSQVTDSAATFRGIYQDRLSTYASNNVDTSTQTATQTATSGSVNEITSLLGGLSGLGLDSSSYLSIMNALMLRQLSDTLTNQATAQTINQSVNEQETVQVTAATDTPDGLPALNLPVTEYDTLINQAAEDYALPAYLIKGVIQTESSFRPNVVSSAGAQGLMQLMPGTADMLGVNDVFDPAQNIDGGSRYLRQLIDRYEGDVRMALAAYNCGPGNVSRMTADSDQDSAYNSIAASVRGYVDNVINNARTFAI